MELKEQIEWLRNFNGPSFNNSWLLNGGENLVYDQAGTGAGGSYYYTLYYWLNNSAVNKWQRYLGRVLYLDNSIAQTAVNKLTIMAIGSGMRICCSDEIKQRKLDKWVSDNQWKRKEREAFKRTFIEGECFFRVFNNYDVRFVDSDLIYNNGVNGIPQSWQGVISTPDDQENIIGYEIHAKDYVKNTTDTQGEFIPIEEMQHRKNNSLFGARRGFSQLLPIATDLFNCDRLLNNVMQTSNVLAKIAFWRKHKANKSSVAEFKAGISSQQAIANRNFTNTPTENIENYEPGSIPDISDETDIQFPDAQSLDQYNTILEATLRKVSSQFNLPSGIFNITKDDGAYNAQMVTNSFIVKAVQSLQEEWKEYNLNLLEKCGFECDDIQIIAPEVAVVDPDSLVNTCTFLLSNGLACKETIDEKFGLNYDKELESIKKEMPNDPITSNREQQADNENKESEAK